LQSLTHGKAKTIIVIWKSWFPLEAEDRTLVKLWVLDTQNCISLSFQV